MAIEGMRMAEFRHQRPRRNRHRHLDSVMPRTLAAEEKGGPEEPRPIKDPIDLMRTK
jgi:hypothetical protein